MSEEGSLTHLNDLSADTDGVYTFMCKVILPCSVGKQNWKKNCHLIAVSGIGTLIDEEFSILVLRNYWKHWWAIIKAQGSEEEAARNVKTLWTNDGWDSQAKINGEWSREGQNELGKTAKQVTQDQQSQDVAIIARREAFKKRLLDSYKAEHAKRDKKKRKAPPVSLGDYKEDMDLLNTLLAAGGSSVIGEKGCRMGGKVMQTAVI